MDNKLRIVAIVQARMGSSRLPGKVLKKIGGKSVIEILLSRLSQSKLLTSIIVATSLKKENDLLCKELLRLGYPFYRGSENDVLKRYYYAALKEKADVIVRITGDCPLIDAQLVDSTINLFLKKNVDYVSNSNPPTFPDGMDVEVFSKYGLFLAHKEATQPYQREHVTPFLRSTKFKTLNLKSERDYSNFRLTLDELDDLKLIQAVFKNFSSDIYFGYEKVIDYLRANPQIKNINKDILRNEGAEMTKGQKLYKRAKKAIAGGTSLLSKRPEMFLPNYWPSYFSKTKGVKIWDLDDHEYLDMGLMGVGTNTLGYSNPEVDDAVRRVVDSGNLSSLNCYEEVLLAEKLLEINPWASKVRFARSGGEANAIAVRIARAVVKNKKIAVCGYHGWHDWYLAANIGKNESLDGHLLPGLKPLGVPRDLEGSIYTFEYNDYDKLLSLVEENNIGVIKMEVMRNHYPTNNFLKKVRDLATKKGILLIFDECSSGFRETFGGLFKKYKVNPDIAIFGKTLGNGYAITAVVGTESVMQSAQDTFISSTFWTERIGPAAALKALEIMDREQSWSKITQIGQDYRSQLQDLSNEIGIKLQVSGIPALTFYSVSENLQQFSKTYITQELIKKGILASTAFYPSIEHNAKHLEYFFETLRPILQKIENIERKGEAYEQYLDGPLCHSGFSRLN